MTLNGCVRCLRLDPWLTLAYSQVKSAKGGVPVKSTKLTASEIIDRELRATGTSLSAWAAENGYTRAQVAHMIDGENPPTFNVLGSLADAIGVSPISLAFITGG